MQADLSVTGAATRIEGPLLFLQRTLNVGLNEAVEVIGGDGRRRLGRITALDEEFMVIEVLESTEGLSPSTARVRFLGEPLHFTLGLDMLGRIFNGVGQVID
jgi:V/A-type H+-transporting ATPase subunit B